MSKLFNIFEYLGLFYKHHCYRPAGSSTDSLSSSQLYSQGRHTEVEPQEEQDPGSVEIGKQQGEANLGGIG